MDLSKYSFDWAKARAFMAVAEGGSFSAAARALGQTQPTLGRQIAALEEELNLVLFERIGRGVTLTPAGRSLLPHIEQMAEAAHALALSASSQAKGLEGVVRISASDLLATYVVPPILAGLKRDAPKLQIELRAENSISDLLRREADIAIRHIRPDAPDLIAKLIREDETCFCAAPTYLSRMGTPKTRADLAAHHFVGFDHPDRMIPQFEAVGIRLSAAQIPVFSGDGNVAMQLVRQGLGIAILTPALLRHYPDLQIVLPAEMPLRFGTWLLAHRELLVSDRIRFVYDALAHGVREQLG